MVNESGLIFMSTNTTENMTTLTNELEAESPIKISLGSNTLAKLAGYENAEDISNFKEKIGNPKGIVNYETIKEKLTEIENTKILENYKPETSIKRSSVKRDIKSKGDYLREAANLLDEIAELEKQINIKRKAYERIKANI